MNEPNTNPDYLLKDELNKPDVTFHNNGRIKSERHYTDGQILLKEKFYADNGMLCEIVNYKKEGDEYSRQTFDADPKRSGLNITYYSNGNVQSQKYFVDGLLHWEEKIFSESGELLELITYKKGGKNGPHILYNESGNKISEINYSENLPHGNAMFFYEDGQLKATTQFDGGFQTGGAKVYYRNGILKISENLEDDLREGITRTFYESGGIKEEWNFHNGLASGENKFYYRSGTLFGVKNYEKGKEEGLSTFYHENGNLKEEINYTEGKKDGPNTFYNLHGQIKKELTFSDGNMIEEVIHEVENDVISDDVPQTTIVEPEPEHKKNVSKTNVALIIAGFFLLLYFTYTFIIYLIG